MQVLQFSCKIVSVMVCKFSSYRGDEPAGSLTPERITKSTGLSVTDAQPIKIKGATGLTFKSDNPAFYGATSEGWFTYGGNVYEISTYARDDAFLKSILASWTF